MTTAETSWENWSRYWPYTTSEPMHSPASRESYLAGYRDALLNAAEEIGDETEAAWLRKRAPETKD